VIYLSTSLVPRPLPPEESLFGGEWPGDEATSQRTLHFLYRHYSPMERMGDLRNQSSFLLLATPDIDARV